jgi:energy-coupling factor transporter transmembrane protein EcfT
MIGVAAVDRWAVSGTSWLHRTTPLPKWLIVAATVALAVVARSPWPLLAAYLLLILVVVSCRLPVRTFILASLLPIPMFGLVALTRWNGSAAVPLAIVGKGMNMTLSGLLVAATTPYPDLLAPPTRVLPPLLADSLVLTYRAVFILVARVGALWLAVRARGGFSPRPKPGALPWEARGTSWPRRMDVVTTGAALALLRGVDLSARFYEVMRLRGYQGRLSPTRSLRPQWTDWPALLLALALLALAIVAAGQNVA